MNKVGIITFHGAHNYGSALQVYALQKVITDKLYYPCEIIDFRTEAQKDQYRPLTKRKGVKYFLSQGLKIRFRLQNKFQLTIEKGSKSKSVPFYKDNYFLGFMRKLFYRNVCYQCKYAQPKRVGDLTIGDFWGFDSKKTFPAEHSKGLSLVLINTKKGHDFFETVKDELIFQKREVKEAIAGNPQLNYPSKRNVFFYRFRRLYLKYGFEKASKRILWPYKIAYNINYIIQRISKGIKDKKNI